MKNFIKQGLVDVISIRKIRFDFANIKLIKIVKALNLDSLINSLKKNKKIMLKSKPF